MHAVDQEPAVRIRERAAVLRCSIAWLKTALANLSVMYEAIQAVSHILDPDQLLERIMDLIFRSLEADRGCVMLRNSVLHEPAAGLEPRPEPLTSRARTMRRFAALPFG